jgi:D-alanyl-D-alanine carboxypeptidase
MKGKKGTLVILATILMLTSCGVPGADSSNQPELPYAEELQQALENGLAQYGGMGISAAVIAPGYRTWSGVSGISHGLVQINSDTLFSAGSINKMFTAVTILQLAQERVLSLEDPINIWLPEYRHIDGSITIRQLLNHTGGLFDMVRHPDYWEDMLIDPDKVWAPEEIINNYLMEPYFPKGSDWHYSTSGYILLRMIIAEATGLEAASVYRERLFVPLALEHTYVAGQEQLPGNTAHGWFDINGDDIYDELPSFMSFDSGIGGAVYSTPKDLAGWAQALFREGRLLDENSFEQLLYFHTPTPGEPLVTGYGLGVAKFNPELFNGLEIWGHSGNAPGYAAACFYLPEYGISIGMMVNTEAGEAMRTINDFLTIITTHFENK